MHRPVQKLKAFQQWTDLVNNITRTGAQVQLISATPHLPDMVFAANLGLIYGNKAVAANFDVPARWGEAWSAAGWLEQDGFDIYHPRNKYEGQGDSLVDHAGRIWFGHGFRSSSDAADEICNEFLKPDEYYKLELVLEDYYHLDTCFCPLENGEVMIYKPAFTKDGYALMCEKFGEDNVIEVNKMDAANFVCNAINLGDQIICNKISPELRYELEIRGYFVTESNMSEFLLSGGSTKCCVLHLTSYPWSHT